jgi:translation initiation factor 1
MPFTIGGDWIPSKSNEENQKPVKVRLVKRGKSILTVILNLKIPAKEVEILAKDLKMKLGCGGAIIDNTIEIQGDKVDQVKKHLDSLGIKSS